MQQVVIQDIANGINRRFVTPRRLNALFLSRVMADGETMRNLIHGCSAAVDDIMKALIAYYENHDAEKLIEKIDKLSLDYPSITFCKERKEDCDRVSSQPTKPELDEMKRLAEYSASQPDKFWEDERLYEKAAIFAAYYGDFFYYNKEGHYIVDETKPIVIYENKQPFTLYDNTYRESHWLDLSRYDEKHTLEIQDEFAAPFLKRKYVGESVIDVLRKTVSMQKMATYSRPHTGDDALDKVCGEIYDDERLSAPKFVKAITLLNRHFLSALKGEKRLGNEDYNTAAMLVDKAPQYFAKIDYPQQFGFYKSDAGQELLKFSFMTTFTNQQKFDEQVMNDYLLRVKDAGHWMNGQHLMTKMIVANTNNLGGINRGLLDLNLIRPRPKEFYGMKSPRFLRAINDYYDQDLARMNYAQLALSEKNKSI